jgi:hypothetical protein
VLITLRTYGRLAAAHEVEQLQAGTPGLLTALGDDPADPAAVRRQVVDLHKRVYAEVWPDDHPEIAATVSLFDDLHVELGDPYAAWEAVLWAMFQDYKMVTY